MATLPVPEVAIFTLEAPAVPRLVVPEEESVVKAPVEAVVAPIAVELIPVAVVLKLLEVKVKALDPALIEDAPKPERLSVPEVAVKFNPPVVNVKPFEAVKV